MATVPAQILRQSWLERHFVKKSTFCAKFLITTVIFWLKFECNGTKNPWTEIRARKLSQVESSWVKSSQVESSWVKSRWVKSSQVESKAQLSPTSVLHLSSSPTPDIVTQWPSRSFKVPVITNFQFIFLLVFLIQKVQCSKAHSVKFTNNHRRWASS